MRWAIVFIAALVGVECVAAIFVPEARTQLIGGVVGQMLGLGLVTSFFAIRNGR